MAPHLYLIKTILTSIYLHHDMLSPQCVQFWYLIEIFPTEEKTINSLLLEEFVGVFYIIRDKIDICVTNTITLRIIMIPRLCMRK